MKEILPISDLFDQPEDNEPTETKLSKAVAELLDGTNNELSTGAIDVDLNDDESIILSG